tara:strand:- start:500 stop:1156 length:657 start_codon:yes stop_codon:yes gene_type:complete
MSYNFIKKNKSKVYYFIIFLIVVTIFNYIFQISNVEKIYSLNLSLKKQDDFKINESAYTNKIGEESLSAAIVGQTIEKYERKVEIKMQEKINFEINYDKDLIEISKVCRKLRITINGKYYFISCQTSNVEKTTKIIVQSLENVLKKILSRPEINLIEIVLNQLSINSYENKNNNLIIVNKKIYYTKNIIKNIIILDGVLIIMSIIYIFNIRKIKKIFS